MLQQKKKEGNDFFTWLALRTASMTSASMSGNITLKSVMACVNSNCVTPPPPPPPAPAPPPAPCEAGADVDRAMAVAVAIAAARAVGLSHPHIRSKNI